LSRIVERGILYKSLIYTFSLAPQIRELRPVGVIEALDCIADSFWVVTPLNEPLGKKC